MGGILNHSGSAHLPHLMRAIPGGGGYSQAMSDVTRILSAIEQGDPHAAEQLLPLVYDELRKLAAQKMAQEKPGQTLQATALVHEAYLRLVDAEMVQRWNSRGHFFAAAAEAMRRILVEGPAASSREARRRRSNASALLDLRRSRRCRPNDLLALDEALAKLTDQHRRKPRLSSCVFSRACSLEEAAECLGISRPPPSGTGLMPVPGLFGQLNQA